METQADILNKIQKDIQSMIKPTDRLCATVATNLGQVIALLLTKKDEARLKELERICNELFEEAEKAGSLKLNPVSMN